MPYSIKEKAKVYHGIIRNEYNMALTNEGFIKNPSYYLTYKDLLKKAKELGAHTDIVDDLINQGYIIEVGNDKYRSIHMDVAIRASDVRIQYGGTRYVTSARIYMYEIPFMESDDRIYFPSKQGMNIENYLFDYLKLIFKNTNLLEIFLESLRAYLKAVSRKKSQGLDAYQVYSLYRILKDYNEKRVFVLSAPTGSGKTEIFLTMATALALANKTEDRTAKIRSIIVYPRIALESDQAFRFILFTYLLNMELRRKGVDISLTIGIDDGLTRKIEREMSEKAFADFRGITCPRCYLRNVSEEQRGILKVLGKYHEVQCNLCKESFNFIKATHTLMKKETPDIYITNPWTLEYRLCESEANRSNRVSVKAFTESLLLVLDEAHEYKTLIGGALRYTIRTLDFISKNSIRVIISSATIPAPLDFAHKLSGFKNEDILVLEYGNSLRKCTSTWNLKGPSGRRLILSEVISVNPYVSWATYICQLLIMLSTLFFVRRYARDLGYNVFIPQTIAFVDNIHEIRRIRRQYDESINLGDPKDHLDSSLIADNLERYAYIPYGEYKNIKLTYNTTGKYFELRYGGRILQFRKLDMLHRLLEECHSEVEPHIRSEVQNKLAHANIASVLATSALELGVDYKGVSFIINAGFPEILSLIQRIGRGGRAEHTLYTVLGIIIIRNNPVEMYWAHRPDLQSLLNPREVLKKTRPLRVTYQNPSIKQRALFHAALTVLALNDEKTHTSGEIIKDFELRISSKGLMQARSLYENILAVITLKRYTSMFKKLIEHLELM